jgi:hypothetical protein
MMSIQVLIALLVAGVYALLSALHVYWAAGGRWASVGVVPHVDGVAVFKPSTTASLLVAVALAAASTLVLCGAGLLPWPLPDSLLRPALYVLGALFALRAIGDFRLVGFFKRVRGTRFARLDDWLFAPLCAALAGGVLWLAQP